MDNLRRTIDRFPTIAGQIALRFYKDRFVYKNWIDTNRKPWKKTRKTKGSTLVDTGTLKRSIRVVYRDNNKVIIGTDVPYAKIHNQGGTIRATQRVRSHSRKRDGRTQQVKAHSRQVNIHIPQRQFMGQSSFLNKTLERRMEIEIVKAIDNV